MAGEKKTVDPALS
jgi:hypothetical protein